MAEIRRKHTIQYRPHETYDLASYYDDETRQQAIRLLYGLSPQIAQTVQEITFQVAYGRPQSVLDWSHSLGKNIFTSFINDNPDYQNAMVDLNCGRCQDDYGKFFIEWRNFLAGVPLAEDVERFPRSAHNLTPGWKALLREGELFIYFDSHVNKLYRLLNEGKLDVDKVFRKLLLSKELFTHKYTNERQQIVCPASGIIPRLSACLGANFLLANDKKWSKDGYNADDFISLIDSKGIYRSVSDFKDELLCKKDMESIPLLIEA